MNDNTRLANIFLDKLMEILPLAQFENRLELWAYHYTQGYMLKLRSMK